ncbi:head GIN domain-containing protein [Longitalea luteola]|uniref:head GIN domain-containing protein n=1 Tax=Longitalea luteola TaxID=2812563 RepID=UPI001A974A48|nr:head GIN domain-containing protein [Longitalea luteola]
MKKSIFILLASTLLFNACMWDGDKRIEGNGNVTTVNKSPGEFTGVELRGNFEVYLTEGNQASVKIEADENLQQHIKVQVANGVLKLETTDDAWLKSRDGVKVYVTSPQFNNIKVISAGTVTGQSKISADGPLTIACPGAGSLKLDVDAPEINASISGAGEITLSGETKKFTAEVTGLGGINAMNLLTEESDLTIAGAGNVEVYASVKLDATISGAGNVRYKGGAQVDKTITGLGNVSKVD